MLNEEHIFRKKLSEVSLWIDTYVENKKWNREIDVLIAIIDRTLPQKVEKDQKLLKKNLKDNELELWRTLIHDAKIKEALKKMRDCCAKYPFLNNWRDHISLYLNRHTEILKANQLGTISHKDFSVEQNKIVKSILDTITEIGHELDEKETDEKASG